LLDLTDCLLNSLVAGEYKPGPPLTELEEERWLLVALGERWERARLERLLSVEPCDNGGEFWIGTAVLLAAAAYGSLGKGGP
jgi:hypothetical protein